MDKLITIDALAAPLLEDGIDTDIICPARFLVRVDKKNIGECLFYDRRILKNGTLNPDFVLNQAGYKQANVILSGRNFGCGSSREHAVWAIRDYGIKAVIAESFGEIFYMNCINNQILPIKLPSDACKEVSEIALKQQPFQINLETQNIHFETRTDIPFTLADEHRIMLMEGLDEITMQLQNDMDDIVQFEETQKRSQPWLWAQN